MSLFATLGLNSEDFNKALDEAQKTAKEFGDSLKTDVETPVSSISKEWQEWGTALQTVSKKTRLASAGAGGLVAGLGRLTYKAGVAADDLNTLSKITGISTEELQKMEYASDLVDVSVETVTGSLRRLTMNMSNAKNGTGSAGDAFQRLGVKFMTSNGTLRDSQEVFYDLLEALGEIEEGSERDALAMEVFGRSATDLNPIIGDGAKQMKELGIEAEKAGLILSQDALDGANKLNDAIDILKARIQATGTAVGAEIAETVAPAVEKLGDWVSDILAWVRDLGADRLLNILKISAVVAGISPVLSVLGKLATAMSAIVTHPLIAAGVGIVALIGGIVTAINAIPKPLSEAQQKYKDIAADIEETNKRISENNTEIQNRIDKQTAYNKALTAEYDDYGNLLNRLQFITDEQGHVLENYQDEVWFIKNDLAEGLGIEMSIIDNQIENYQDLTKEIYDTIAAKKAEALLRANEDIYNEALGKQVELYNDVASATENYNTVVSGLNEVVERRHEIEDELQRLYDSGEASRAENLNYILTLRDEYDGLESDLAFYGSQLQSVSGALYQANEAYNKNMSVINNYDRVVEAAKNGTMDLDTALTVLSNGMRTAADADAETLRRQLTDYESTYESMKRAVQEGGAKITQTQFEEMEKMIAITQQELGKANGEVVRWKDDMFNSAYYNGRNVSQGLADGIDDYAYKVSNAAARLADRASRGVSYALMISSPSKLMAQYGKFVDQGLAEGIEDNLRLVDDAVSAMTDIITDSGESWDMGEYASNISPQNVASPEAPTAITMNIYGAQGQDVNELAEIISRKINDAVARDRRVFA